MMKGGFPGPITILSIFIVFISVKKIRVVYRLLFDNHRCRVSCMVITASMSFPTCSCLLEVSSDVNPSRLCKAMDFSLVDNISPIILSML